MIEWARFFLKGKAEGHKTEASTIEPGVLWWLMEGEVAFSTNLCAGALAGMA